MLFCGVELRLLNLGAESLKVCIDDERSRQLLVVVLKGELVLTLFRHLHPDCGLPNRSTVGSVGFQQILPCVAVQAALAEVLALLVLTLLVQKCLWCLWWCLFVLSFFPRDLGWWCLFVLSFFPRDVFWGFSSYSCAPQRGGGWGSWSRCSEICRPFHVDPWYLLWLLA